MAMKQRTNIEDIINLNKKEREEQEIQILKTLNNKRLETSKSLSEVSEKIDKVAKKQDEQQKVILDLQTEQYKIEQEKTKTEANSAAQKSDLKKKNRNFFIRFGIGMGVGVAAGIATILVSPLVFAAPIAATIACGAVAGAGLLHGIGETIINFLPWTKRAKLRRQLKRIKKKEYDVVRLKLEDNEKEIIKVSEKLQKERAELEDEKRRLEKMNKYYTQQCIQKQESIKSTYPQSTNNVEKLQEKQKKINELFAEIEAIKQEAKVVSKEQEKAKKEQEKIVPADKNVTEEKQPKTSVEEKSTQSAYKVIEENLAKKKKFAAGIMFGDNGETIELA